MLVRPPGVRVWPGRAGACYGSCVIDFDRNATAPLHPAARAAMQAVLDGDPLGNPSSVHRHGQRARGIVERSRRTLASALCAAPGEIVFTSGGTEADALAILGAMRARAAVQQSSGLACTAIEHPAVLGAATRLRREGHAVVTIAVDGDGRIDPDVVAAAVRDHAELGMVSISAAHHELGNVTALAEIVAAVRGVRHDVLVHTDAVQALGRRPLSFAEIGVDLLSVSAHKIGGPPGVGALVCARHVPLAPLWDGGQQQAGRRPGTESVLAAAGFAAAIAAACAGQSAWATAVAPVGCRLRAGLEALGGRLFGDRRAHLGNTALVAFEGCDGHLAMMALDGAGFACSTGAACSTGTVEPSTVLRALGCDSAQARGALRFSIGSDHTATDVDALLAVLPDVLAAVRLASAQLWAGQLGVTP